MAQLYESELIAVADRLVPSRTVRCRQRPSDPWFDDDCRVAKRSTRLFERRSIRAARAEPFDAAASTTAEARWYERRRAYRALTAEKRRVFWQSKITAEQSSPHQLWHSIDVLLGRGSAPTTAAVTAVDAHRFFDEKVAGVQSSTANAPLPSFTAAPLGVVLRVFRPLTTDDVTDAVRLLPDKQCICMYVLIRCRLDC